MRTGSRWGRGSVVAALLGAAIVSAVWVRPAWGTPPGKPNTKDASSFGAIRAGASAVGAAAPGAPSTYRASGGFASRAVPSFTREAMDLHLPGVTPGLSWSHVRTYDSSLVSENQNALYCRSGERWWAETETCLWDDEGSDHILVFGNASTRRWFTTSGVPDDFDAVGTAQQGDKQYTLRDVPSGIQYIYKDFDVSHGNSAGRLKAIRQLGSSTGSAYSSYYSNGTLACVTTSQGLSVIYTYNSGAEAGKVDTIDVRRSDQTVLEKVEYLYFDEVASPSNDIGSSGDLVQVKVSTENTDGSYSVRYTQYRYYRSGSQDGDPHQLKAEYDAGAVERILADTFTNVSTPEDILKQADSYSTGGSAAISAFATRSVTYYTSNLDTTQSVQTPWGSQNLKTKYCNTYHAQVDEDGALKTETIRTGCGSCGGGAGGVTKTFFYMALTGAPSNANDVVRIVVEDTEDSGGAEAYRTLYGLNADGRELRKAVIQNPTLGTQVVWCQSTKLGTSSASPKDIHRVKEERSPSAHDVDSDADLTKFLDPLAGTNDADTLRDSDGLIVLRDYNDDGYSSGTKAKEGEGGTGYYLSATDYGDGSSVAKQLPVATYRYPTKTSTRTDASRETTSYAYTFWNGDINVPQVVTVTYPAVDATRNGSGTATVEKVYYDDLGRMRWRKDGEGTVTYSSPNPSTGGVGYQMVDVETDDLPADITSGSSGKWLSWSGSVPSGFENTDDTNLQLVTKTEYDDLGRVRRTLQTDVTGSPLVEHWIVYEDNRTLEFPYWDSGTSQPRLAIRATETNDAGQAKATYSIQAARTAASGGKPTGLLANTGQSHYLSWSRNGYDAVTGDLETSDRYHDVPASGDGTLSTNFHRTIHQSDEQGRPEYTIEVVSGTTYTSSVEEVTQQVYDVLGRVVEVKRGVSSAAHSMDAAYTTYPTLEEVTATVYDSGGVGDGLVTKVRRYHGTGATDMTGENYYYTYRGHRRGVAPFWGNETAQGPFTVSDVSWEGHTTATALYTSNPTWTTVLTGDGYTDYAASTSTNRRTLSKALFDDLGREYRSERYSVAASNGAAGDKLVEDRYYDRNGRVVAVAEQYGAAREHAFDAAGRAVETRVVAELNGTKYASGVFQYQTPAPVSDSGGDDKVIEIDRQVFDGLGNVIGRHRFEVNHDDTDGLDLSNHDDVVRSTVYSWYDGANRLVTQASYGSGDTAATGAGAWKWFSAPARPGTAPTDSDDQKLVVEYSYTELGQVETVTDTSGTVTRTTYDDLGRAVKVEEDDGGASERWSLVEYDGLGNATRRIADLGKDDTLTGGAWTTDADSEVTKYYFGDAYSARLATDIVDPDSTDDPPSGTDHVKLVHALDGKVTRKTDQRGTVIDYAYNNRRQAEKEQVTTLGGVDDHIRCIQRGYDTLGRLETVTSWQNSDGTGTVRNQVKWHYDDLGHVAKSFQSHEGVVDDVEPGTSPCVEYAYDTTASSGSFTNGARLKNVKYPGGRRIHVGYSASDSIPDRLHRVTEVFADHVYYQGTPGTQLIGYKHSGTGRLAEADLLEPDYRLTYHQDADDDYEGFDRFGRVKDQYWDGYNSTSDPDRFEYAHDYDGSPIQRKVTVVANSPKSQAFEYDPLSRLTGFYRGIVFGGSIPAPNLTQGFTLDAVGNWSEFKHDGNGDGDWGDAGDLDQDRTHNLANEVTGLTETPGSAWFDPVYDAAGNVTEGPKVGTESLRQYYAYDAWNRIVRVSNHIPMLVASFEYDGLHRRIAKTDPATVTYDYYFNEGWQALEVRKSADTDPWKQYVWHPYYIDALAIRYWDDNVDGSGIVTHYFAHDANMNLTALVGNTGTMLERYEYTPYGRVTVLDPDFASDADGASDYAHDVLYTGQTWETEAALYNYRMRQYHPTLGRFLQRDPIGGWGDVLSRGSSYAYAANEPTSHSDTFGLAVDNCERVGDFETVGPRTTYSVGSDRIGGFGVLAHWANMHNNHVHYGPNSIISNDLSSHPKIADAIDNVLEEIAGNCRRDCGEEPLTYRCRHNVRADGTGGLVTFVGDAMTFLTPDWLTGSNDTHAIWGSFVFIVYVSAVDCCAGTAQVGVVVYNRISLSSGLANWPIVTDMPVVGDVLAGVRRVLDAAGSLPVLPLTNMHTRVHIMDDKEFSPVQECCPDRTRWVDSGGSDGWVAEFDGDFVVERLPW